MAQISVFWFDESYWREQAAADRPREDLALAVKALFTPPDFGRADLRDREIPDGVVGVVADPDLGWPRTFRSESARVLHWSRGRLSPEDHGDDVADWLDNFPGDLGPDLEGPVSVCTVDDERPEHLDAGALTNALESFQWDWKLRSATLTGGQKIHRPVRVAWRSECVIVAWGNTLWLPAAIDEPRRQQLLRALAPWRPPATGAAGGRAKPAAVRLSLDGFVFWSGAPLWLPCGPGRTAVLFGRNGAGKTLVLESAGAALSRLSEVPFPVTGTAGLADNCVVLLAAETQDSASEVFAPLLAHLGWSPLTYLVGGESEADIGRRLPAWTSFDIRPDDARGDSVDALANRPVGELRRAIVDALCATAPWGEQPDARVLTEALLSSAVVAVSPDWTVSLAVHPGRLDHGLRAAAVGFLDRLASGAAMAPGTNLNQHLTVIRLAEALRDGSPEPIVSRSAKLVGIPNVTDQHDAFLGVTPGSGWPGAGKALSDALRAWLPVPVRFEPAPVDGTGMVETALLTLVDHLLGEAAAPDPPGSHPFSLGALPARCAELLGEWATGMLPPFVRQRFRLEARVTPPTTWHHQRVEAVLVDGTTGDSSPLEVAPAGVRSWGSASLRFAGEHLRRATWAGKHRLFGAFECGPDQRSVTFPGGASLHCNAAFEEADGAGLSARPEPAARILHLLDEPEAHLHLTAQADAAAATAALAEAGSGAIVATHSLAFLDVRGGETLTLSSSPEGIDGAAIGGLRSLAAQAETLGVRASALAQVCRGVLVVEGPNDVGVIDRYGGIDLDKQLVVVVPIAGHYGTPSIAELEFLHTLRIPLFVLLDGVRRSILVDALEAPDGSPRLSAEETSLLALHRGLVQRRFAAWVLPFARHDIVRAVPDGDIEWAVKEGGGGAFPGWAKFDVIAEDAWTSRRVPFKASFEHITGVAVDRVLRILLGAPATEAVSPELHGLLSTLLETRDAPPGPGLTLLDPHRRPPG